MFKQQTPTGWGFVQTSGKPRCPRHRSGLLVMVCWYIELVASTLALATFDGTPQSFV